MENIIRVKDYMRNISVESDTDMYSDEFTEILHDVLYKANKENRLIKGIYESAHVLEMFPETVDICVLPVMSNSNISAHIQHKLIQAFCWENDIQIFEMLSADLHGIISPSRTKGADGNDFGCVLVTTKPVDHESDVEEFDSENFG